MIKRWIAKLFGLHVPPQIIIEPEPEYDYMGYTMTDEETGMTLSVLMICGCGGPVVVAGADEKNFWCEHCDRECTEDKPCGLCEAHFIFDAEAAKAEAAGFYYDDEEE